MKNKKSQPHISQEVKDALKKAGLEDQIEELSIKIKPKKRKVNYSAASYGASDDYFMRPKGRNINSCPALRGINWKKIFFGLTLILVGALGVIGISVFLFLRSENESEQPAIPDYSANDYTTSMRGEIPSSCGYTIGRPTTVVEDETYLEWSYEEIAMGGDAFRGLAPAESINQGVLLASLQFKDPTDTFQKQRSETGYFSYTNPGLVSMCVNNTQNLTLEDFVEFAANSGGDKFEITLNGPSMNKGEIEVQPITLKGVYNGGYVNEPFYLAVIPSESDFSRLVIFQPWDSHEERLKIDSEAIFNSLKQREITSLLTVPKIITKNQAANNTMQNTASQPECQQYTIREGEFASDKCYNEKDYADLKYYLQRYNGAISSQNAAARGSKITCNGSEFFKDECEEDKQQYEQALKDQEEYKVKIVEIIAKGK